MNGKFESNSNDYDESNLNRLCSVPGPDEFRMDASVERRPAYRWAHASYDFELCSASYILLRFCRTTALRREKAGPYLKLEIRHCERSKAIHLSACRVTMDCFASLGMTAVP